MTMRGELLAKALEFIGDAVAGTGEFLEVFLASTKSDYRPLRYGIRPKRITIDHEKLTRQQLYDLMYRLRRDGLIVKAKKRRGVTWLITAKGKSKMAKLAARFAAEPPPPRYEAEPSDAIVIVAFDIPEKERRKRVWLRSALKNLGFRLLQKSVWIGKVKIPELFLEDLRRFKLIAYTEIFAISKRGSIRHIA